MRLTMLRDISVAQAPHQPHKVYKKDEVVDVEDKLGNQLLKGKFASLTSEKKEDKTTSISTESKEKMGNPVEKNKALPNAPHNKGE